MIKHYMLFDKTSGLFLSHLTADEDQLGCNTPSGCGAVEGLFDHMSQRVDMETGKVVDYQPPKPSADHEWNGETKRWQITAGAADKINRSNAAHSRIAQLEASQHRHVREHCLGIAGAAERLKAIDDEIFSLQSHLQ